MGISGKFYYNYRVHQVKIESQSLLNLLVHKEYPFWHMTVENPKAAYACINKGEA